MLRQHPAVLIFLMGILDGAEQKQQCRLARGHGNKAGPRKAFRTHSRRRAVVSGASRLGTIRASREYFSESTAHLKRLSKLYAG